jgi:hypothetical protein
MSDIDNFLERIADKKALKDWVDELPEDCSAVVLSWKENQADGKEYYSYKSVGQMTIAEANYMIDLYKKYLLGYTAE